MNKKYTAFILFLFICVIMWNFLDLVLSALISHTAYHFNVLDGLVQPLVIASVMGYFFVLRNNGGNNGRNG